MKKFYLYRIKVNKFFYYGIAKNINSRKNRHLQDLRNRKHHNIILQRSFNKKQNFIFEVLVELDSRVDALELEAKYIADYDCVNLTCGGDGGDTISMHPLREDIIRRTQATRKQQKITLSDKFVENQGTISQYADIICSTYTCKKCKREIKGKANFLRYHGKDGELCGKPTKKHYNNGVIQKFMYEDELKGSEWVRGKIKKL